MRKKELSLSQTLERLDEQKLNRQVAGFKAQVTRQIKEKGYNCVRLQLEWLKEHPNAQLPRPFLNHAQTVEIFERAINDHLKQFR